MKKTFIVVLLTLAFSLLTGESKNKKLNIGILNGPSAVPAAYIIENNPGYEFQIFSGADLEIPKLLKGEIDIGILPPNAAAKLWEKSGGNLAALSVIGEGNLSLLTTDPSYKNLQSLEGKTVFCAGRGATPEYVFRHVLNENKISNVNLDFSIPNPELAGSLISQKVEYILVPEPFATVALLKGKTAGVKKVEDLSSYFKENFPMTLLVCNKKILENKEKEIKEYLSLYEEAVQWTNKNPAQAGLLVEKHTLGLNAEIAAASIPNGRYVFFTTAERKTQIENILSLFQKQNPESVGQKLPDSGFYR